MNDSSTLKMYYGGCAHSQEDGIREVIRCINKEMLTQIQEKCVYEIKRYNTHPINKYINYSSFFPLKLIVSI
jgi:hypothetical protein